MIDAIIKNRWHYCGAVIARLGVNVATLIWALVVLLNDDALAIASYGHVATTYVSEDTYGWFFLIVSVTQLYRIVRQSKPNPIGVIGYGAMLAGWAFVDGYILFAQRPMQPTAMGCVTVVMLAAVYAFVANPRTRCDVA